jgi:hypothetical protein
MASNALYKQLEVYNKNFKNDFKENWGSLLTYLQVNDTEMMMRASNNYSINLENKSGLTKQTLYRKKENNSSNRHTKLESLSRNRSIKTGPGISRLNITNKLQNTLNQGMTTPKGVPTAKNSIINGTFDNSIID